MAAAKSERPSVLGREGQGQGGGVCGWLATFERQPDEQDGTEVSQTHTEPLGAFGPD